MYKNKNQKILQPLLDRFHALSNELFKKGDRCHKIDDLFAEFQHAKVSPGEKSIKDNTHGGVRTRTFVYRCNKGKDEIILKVCIVQGEVGESSFTATTRFH